MTLKDHLRSLGDKEFLEELANSEPRAKTENEGKEDRTHQVELAEEAPAETSSMPGEAEAPSPKMKPTAKISGQNPADGRTAKGFVVDNNGSIATNLHLVQAAEKIRVEFASGDVFLGRVSKTDEARDLALVKVPGATPVFGQMGSTAGLDVGDTVLVLAKAVSATGQMVQATVCALRRINGTLYIQVDQTLNNQDSGSPFTDQDGKILGISNVRAGDSTPDVGFAVSVAELKSFISG